MGGESLGGRISDARVKAGLSQIKLAGHLGIRRQTVIKWESDNAVPSAATIQRVATALHVPVAELTGEVAPSAPPAPESAPALKTWVTGQLATVTQGLNNYLEDIIENEVRRRILAMDDEAIARLRREAQTNQLDAEAVQEVQRVGAAGTKTPSLPQGSLDAEPEPQPQSGGRRTGRRGK